eukprot:1059067_1
MHSRLKRAVRTTGMVGLTNTHNSSKLSTLTMKNPTLALLAFALLLTAPVFGAETEEQGEQGEPSTTGPEDSGAWIGHLVTSCVLLFIISLILSCAWKVTKTAFYIAIVVMVLIVLMDLSRGGTTDEALSQVHGKGSALADAITGYAETLYQSIDEKEEQEAAILKARGWYDTAHSMLGANFVKWYNAPAVSDVHAGGST